MVVSVVMPCLNEHETVALCIRKAKETLNQLGVTGEIVVADNGSTDGSQDIARALGARLVEERERGYGNACRAGIARAQGDYIIIGDSDNSYDFADIECFYEKLIDGYDVVLGTRMKGTIQKGAMPWLHRYIGNPFLTGLLNIIFRPGISDAHCGMRAFTKQAFEKMALQTTGMEFASEMVIKAALLHLKITEIPITLYRDGRSSAPHLRPFRDGWRHLRFILLHSPSSLYMVPGFFMLGLGMLSMIIMLVKSVPEDERIVNLYPMVLGSLLAILGFQTIAVGIYARIYAVTHNFAPDGPFLKKMFRVLNLERGLALGAFVFLLGFLLGIYIFIQWSQNFSGQFVELRLALFSSTLMIFGTQIIFSSFFLSMLGIERKKPSEKSLRHE
ncbi:glycosyltransferase family 2 protein [candidate division KSB1 bacterium]|nr:glycosyltransferase family 2 protein [candidate division KSB1 bacterium]RQW04155.1 MAG: glycosyltransferase family 2 protein [candidate division KSB1 bacterium]